MDGQTEQSQGQKRPVSLTLVIIQVATLVLMLITVGIQIASYRAKRAQLNELRQQYGLPEH